MGATWVGLGVGCALHQLASFRMPMANEALIIVISVIAIRPCVCDARVKARSKAKIGPTEKVHPNVRRRGRSVLDRSARGVGKLKLYTAYFVHNILAWVSCALRIRGLKEDLGLHRTDMAVLVGGRFVLADSPPAAIVRTRNIPLQWLI